MSARDRSNFNLANEPQLPGPPSEKLNLAEDRPQKPAVLTQLAQEMDELVAAIEDIQQANSKRSKTQPQQAEIPEGPQVVDDVKVAVAAAAASDKEAVVVCLEP